MERQVLVRNECPGMAGRGIGGNRESCGIHVMAGEMEAGIQEEVLQVEDVV